MGQGVPLREGIGSFPASLRMSRASGKTARPEPRPLSVKGPLCQAPDIIVPLVFMTPQEADSGGVPMTKMRTLRLREGSPPQADGRPWPQSPRSRLPAGGRTELPLERKGGLFCRDGPKPLEGKPAAGVGGERVVGTESKSTRRRDRDTGTPKIFP